MEINELYKLAENRNVTVDFFPLAQTRALTLEHNGKHYVALSKKISTENEEKVALAHELGHVCTLSLYSPDSPADKIRISERSADGWAVEMLVPLAELITAMKRGDESISALSERFGVSEEFMQKVFAHYSENKTV